jgi:acyl-coenzyme A thioesterase PaaI-like protein
MKEIARYPGCFVCGDQNDIGLQAKFFWDGEKAHCRVQAGKQFAGYRHIYHGGLLSTLLDEVMIKALLAQDIVSVTAEMTVKFKHPVKIGDTVSFEGHCVSSRGRVYLTEGRALNQDGEIVATATGKYIVPASSLAKTLTESLDT